MTATDAAPGGPVAPVGKDQQRPERQPYWQQVHIELITVLAVAVIALSVLGVLWLPQQNGFQSVPEDLSVDIRATGVTGVTETLARTPEGGSTLTLEQNDVPAGTPVGGDVGAEARQHWVVSVRHFGRGHVCTEPEVDGAAFSYSIPVAKVTHPSYIQYDPSEPLSLTWVTGTSVLLVELCWNSGGPVKLNGAYLSAWFPPEIDFWPVAPDGAPLQRPGREVTNISRALEPNAGDTANFVVQSQVPPDTSSATGWQWSAKVGATTPLRVSAVNTSTTQHATYLSFLSGIAFGIAGAR